MVPESREQIENQDLRRGGAEWEGKGEGGAEGQPREVKYEACQRIGQRCHEEAELSELISHNIMQPINATDWP